MKPVKLQINNLLSCDIIVSRNKRKFPHSRVEIQYHFFGTTARGSSSMLYLGYSARLSVRPFVTLVDFGHTARLIETILVSLGTPIFYLFKNSSYM